MQKFLKENMDFVILALLAAFSSLLFWGLMAVGAGQVLGLPETNLLTVAANYDGPNYMVIAKCGYQPECIRSSFSLPLPLEYYPAHWPGYPLLIRVFDLFLPGPLAMLAVTFLGSLFFLWFFWRLAGDIWGKKRAFWLCLVALFLPGRFFVLRMVGAPETWFLASVVASVYYFRREKFGLAALWAIWAQALKSPGILLFASYGIWALVRVWKEGGKEKIRAGKKLILKMWPLLLAPLTIVLVFGLYAWQTGNFWAYFSSGDNFHLYPLPFLTFISTKSWINGIWLEDIVWIYLVMGTAVSVLRKKFKDDILFIFPAFFLAITLFVGHRDIARYVAPVYPFAILAFGKTLTRKSWRPIFWLILPAIFIYAFNFVAGNTAPVADWTPYL